MIQLDSDETLRNLWVDHLHKIVSFKYVTGFEKLVFPTRKEKFEYVFQMSDTGYRIQ